MPGVLEGRRVVVPEEREANQVYNKGAYGTPQSGGSLALELVEATHLVELGRLQVQTGEGAPVGLADLFSLGAARVDDFEIQYVVYRDLRSRGLIVRASDAADFNVLPRGGFPGKTPASARVLARSEATRADAAALLEAAREAERFGKRLIVAVVDAEGDLTYYQASEDAPEGGVPPDATPLEGAAARLLHDRVFVFDEAVAEALHGDEFFGHPVGPALQLSLAEAVWLAEHRGLAVEAAGDAPGGDDGPAGGAVALDAAALRRRAGEVQGDFELRYAAYADLKRRGLIAKTGYKFGAHHRGYKTHPERGHAPYLVHAVPPGHAAPWPEVSGFVRLAHSVRKRMLFAVGPGGAGAGGGGGGGVAYLRLKRTRP